MSDLPTLPANTTRDTSIADKICAGIQRLCYDFGWASLKEFTLPNDRRADVFALTKTGDIIIMEIKSSRQDFLSDGKWEEYLEFCDYFYFAVDENFPQEILPVDHGLMVADQFGGAILQESFSSRLAAARRKSLTLNFARMAALRLQAYGFNDNEHESLPRAFP